MSILNKVDCSTSRKNVGFGDCVLDLAMIAGIIYAPKSFFLSAADMASAATAIAALTEGAWLDAKGRRIYPVHYLVNPQNNSDDKTVQTYSDGSEAVVREGLRKWGWQLNQGGKCLHDALRTHNSNSGSFYFYDKNFTLFGWQKGQNLYPIPVNYKWADPISPSDGSNATVYPISVAFDPLYLSEASGYIKLNADVLGVVGLQDFVLSEKTFDSGTGVAQVYAKTTCSAVDMAVLYGTELATPTAWKAVNAETGNTITIETVTVGGGTNKYFELTFDTADADYPADEGTIILSAALPSVLQGLGVDGFESDELELAVSGS